MGTSTMDPVLLTISPSWISLDKERKWLEHYLWLIGLIWVDLDLTHLPIVAQDDDTHVVRLQVQSHALHSWLELHHLTSLYFGETENSSDTITDWDDGTEFFKIILKS